MNADRAIEFRTGRAYAKCALTKLGLYNVELPVGADRVPIWPPGICGSITHTAGPAGGHVAAAVARTEVVGSIGIDAEMNRTLHPSTWTQFLVDSELQHLQSLPVDSRAGVVLTIWCVKEATVKALGEPIDPMEIGVWRERTVSETQDIWSASIQCFQRTRITLQARTMRLPELILGAVVSARGLVNMNGLG